MMEKIEKIARFYVTYPMFIAKAVAALICIFSLKDWIVNEKTSPVILLVLIQVVFIYPILCLIFSILSFIPLTICGIFLTFVDEHRARKEQQQYQQFRNKDYYHTNHDYKQSQDQKQSYYQYNQYHQSQQNRSYGSQHNSSNYNNTYRNYEQSQNTSQRDDLSIALAFYGLTIPFSEQQLRDRRRKLMKKAHPDAGGSTENAEKVNVYFDILKKYAS